MLTAILIFSIACFALLVALLAFVVSSTLHDLNVPAINDLTTSLPESLSSLRSQHSEELGMVKSKLLLAIEQSMEQVMDNTAIACKPDTYLRARAAEISKSQSSALVTLNKIISLIEALSSQASTDSQVGEVSIPQRGGTVEAQPAPVSEVVDQTVTSAD